jgi:hypothetical protein
VLNGSSLSRPWIWGNLADEAAPQCGLRRAQHGVQLSSVQVPVNLRCKATHQSTSGNIIVAMVLASHVESHDNLLHSFGVQHKGKTSSVLRVPLCTHLGNFLEIETGWRSFSVTTFRYLNFIFR